MPICSYIRNTIREGDGKLFDDKIQTASGESKSTKFNRPVVPWVGTFKKKMLMTEFPTSLITYLT